MIWLISLAWAGALDVERSKTALDEGRPDEALRYAREARKDDESALAWKAYLESCEAAGIGEACRSEASRMGAPNDLPELVRLWHDRTAHNQKPVDVSNPKYPGLSALAEGDLQKSDLPAAYAERLALLAKTDPDRAAELALEWIDAHPERPDVLLGLYDDLVPPRKSIGKLAKKVFRVASKQKLMKPAQAYRWLRLAIAAKNKEVASLMVRKLTEAGEAEPLARKPWSRSEQVNAALSIQDGTLASIPTAIPGEFEGVALRVASRYIEQGKPAKAAEYLGKARTKIDTISLAIAEGEALLDDEQLEAAHKIATEAFSMTSEPWPTDVAVSNRVIRREGVAKVLALRGKVLLEQGDARRAVIDLMIANQLSREPLELGPLEKAMNTAKYELQTIQARLETAQDPAQVVALRKAVQALEDSDLASVTTYADEAIASVCVPSHARARLTATLAGLPEVASAYALLGKASAQAGDVDRGRTQVMIATLLIPWDASPDWWGTLSELQEKSGHEDAAFFADAVRRELSDTDQKEGASTWTGNKEGIDGARAAMVSTWMKEKPKQESTQRSFVEVGRVVHFDTGGGKRGSGGIHRPVLNRAFPAWSLQTATGTVSPRQGRIHIITFFRSDSPSSVRLMTEVTHMAHRLRRQEGTNVVVVGISMDPEESAMNKIESVRHNWGPHGWDPQFGKRLGVAAVPTTWVVDSSGIARFVHVGYLGVAEYEAEVRLISGL